jgi:predicted anti-sigma-YlaC factor YlaD
MDCEKYKKLIQEFHDGELEKSKEAFIFTHLSECEECRGFLKSLNLLSANVQEEISEIPFALEERIFYSIRQNSMKRTSSFFRKRIPAYVVYALGVLLILFTGYLISSTNEYKTELHNAIETVQQKDKELQLIMNSFDEVEIKSKLKNEIIIKTTM